MSRFRYLESSGSIQTPQSPFFPFPPSVTISPEHSRIALHFLNATLGFRNPIVDVTVLNPINLREFDADKLSILDIKAIDRIGRPFNIEVQTTRPLGLAERLYVVPSDNKPIVEPVEQWLCFFRKAANLTAEELALRLPDPVFTEAIGVLQMIAKNPGERQMYEDRLKAERDEWARTAQAE